MKILLVAILLLVFVVTISAIIAIEKLRMFPYENQ
jgi:hypothetical protein